MKSSDILFKLVHSLNRNEKRQFKLFAKQTVSAKGQNYIRLFDALNGMATYDEAALKERFKDEALGTYLSAEKNKLFQLLLKSLRLHQSGKKPSEKLFALIEDARILKNKGLFHASLKHLRKAEKLGRRNEEFTLLLKVFEEEIHLVKQMEAKNLVEKIGRIWEKVDEVQVYLDGEVGMKRIHDQLFALARSSTLEGKSKEDFLEGFDGHPALVECPEEGSFMAKIYYFKSKMLIAQVRRNWAEIYDCQQEMIRLWEAHPERTASMAYEYKILLANSLHSASVNNRMEEVQGLIEKIQALPKGTWNEEAEVFQNVAFFDLLHALSTLDLQRALAQLPTIEAGLKNYRSKINKARELSFLYNMAMVCFLAGDHRKALLYVRRILDQGKLGHRKDIQWAARFLQLVLYADLEMWGPLESGLRSVQRYFRTEEKGSPLEKAFLNGLGNGLLEEAAKARRLLLEMRAVGESLSHQVIRFWLQSRESGRTLLEVAQTARQEEIEGGREA